MSCTSPFVYQEGGSVSNNQTVSVSGSYTLPSYSTPSTSLCLLGSDTSCHWGGWRGWALDCSTSWYWYDCSTVPGIEVWPAITFAASCSIPMTFTSAAGIELSATTPATPYEATSITLNQCNLSLSINGSSVTINVIPEPITVTQENGEFSISVDLASWTSSVDEAGITYKLSIDSTLLFCLDPVPPQGWVNLTLGCTLSANGDGISYSVNFTISCPIVSVED